MPPPRTQLKKPPLIEVFCEFFFQGPDGPEWDGFAVPRFYNKIRKDFPTRKRISSVGVQDPFSAGGVSPGVSSVGPPTPRHRFTSKDGQTIVQLGDNLLVVNQLPPYYGWEKFEPVVDRCFKLYVDLWKPRTVAHAAVHYFDQVDIPEAEFSLETYFNLYPCLPDGQSGPITNLTMAFESKGKTEGDILAVTMRQHPSALPDGTTFLLQYDYLATAGLPAEDERVKGWLETAHEALSVAFRSTFTEAAFRLFDTRSD
jgi:uncharacterized protein (TIGR04255 family)